MKHIEDLDLIVGRQLRQCRKLMGLTQTELAAGLGVSFQQLQKYERGVNRIGAGRLQQAADILHVPISYFFEDNRHDAERQKLIPLLSSPQIQELNNHFCRVSSPTLRQALVELVKAISWGSEDDGVSDEESIPKFLR
ncbi:transcriptional regulator [Metarhizobium album]|uniref:Transcriptional regulator n=1 Tax=Metarhizobium album TaxID=2182425 RepID=A0A2U2DL03_9HYPH|nr:helix-turn-helix transcriptional regulator [Rhizobium album]PWE53950.1 transcriptional regulator [Rhizobium album]